MLVDLFQNGLTNFFLTVEIIWDDVVLCFHVPQHQKNVPSFLEQIFQL